MDWHEVPVHGLAPHASTWTSMGEPVVVELDSMVLVVQQELERTIRIGLEVNQVDLPATTKALGEQWCVPRNHLLLGHTLRAHGACLHYSVARPPRHPAELILDRLFKRARLAVQPILMQLHHLHKLHK